MSMVYKCDRCGKISDNPFDGGGNGPFVWDGTMSKDQENMDLCLSCYESLIRWLDKEKIKSDKHGDCESCKYKNLSECMYPCNSCSHNYADKWEEN